MNNIFLRNLATSLIVLAFLSFSSYTVWAQSSNTGDASAFTCVENLVNTNTDYLAWYNSHCITPTPTETPTPTLTPTPTPTEEVTPTPTPTQTPNVGGPGDERSDGLGCASHDCSNQPQGQVLGASTGPAVLGLSTTSGEESALPLVQLFAAFTSSVVGFKFLKKNG